MRRVVLLQNSQTYHDFAKTLIFPAPDTNIVSWKGCAAPLPKYEFSGFKEGRDWPKWSVAFFRLYVEERWQKRWIVKHADVKSKLVVVYFCWLEIEIAEVGCKWGYDGLLFERVSAHLALLSDEARQADAVVSGWAASSIEALTDIIVHSWGTAEDRT